MANYAFSVDGPETGTVGPGEGGVVGNLAFFDTDDTVSGSPGTSGLGFLIAGPIALNLTGYAGITGFSTVSLQSTGGGVNVTVGQDFHNANASGGSMSFIARSASGASVVLDASALGVGSSVILDARSDGNDVLSGGAYGDNLLGGAGADQFNGGAGFDLVRYDLSPGGVSVNLTAVSGIGSDAQGDTYSNIEGAAGSIFNDLITGGAGFNFLLGVDGDDVLDGGAGADTLDGGAGDDLFHVDDAGDQFAELAGEGSDTVVSTVSYGLFAGQEIEFLETSDVSGTGAIDLRGNTLAQMIEGNDGNNILNDGGVGGADTLTGNGGNDSYSVYNAGAVVVETTGEGNDLVSAGVNYVLASGGSVEYLNTTSLFATYAVNLTGNELVQIVRGNGGANVLDGGGGNDVLFGMGGADSFRFSTALGPGNVARMADFNAAQDQIQLDDAIFTALSLGALAASAFKDIAFAPKDADDRIIYNSDTGALCYDADGSGTAFGNVRFATLTGSPVLTAADFIVL